MADRKFLRIVKGAIKGNEDSFNALMQLRGRNILYIALSLMHQKDDGEDAAQDAIIRIRRDIGKLKNPASFDVWMYRVVYNTCMDAKKNMKRTAANIKPDSSELVLEDREEFLPEEYVHNAEKREDLIAAIKELPDRYRMCLLLYYYEDMNYTDIADVLDINTQNVANTLNRAKKKLRASLVSVDAFVSSDDEEDERKKAAFVALPVLSQVFTLDEQMVVTPSMMNHMFAQVGMEGVAINPSQANSMPNALAGNAGKVVVGIAAVVTATALAIAFYSNMEASNNAESTTSSTQQNIAPGENPESSDAIVPDQDQDKDQNQDQEQDNLNDVIDPSQAEALRTFARQEHSESEWKDFVKQTDLRYEGETLDSSYHYTLYYVDNNDTDKRLMVIERLDNAGKVLVAYSTSGAEEVLPKRAEIIKAFEAWI